MSTVTSLMTNLEATRARLDTGPCEDAEVDRCAVDSARLSDLISRTPARTGAEMKLKLDELLRCVRSGDMWIDQRDEKLAESLAADFERLDGALP
jgi:hypothetical protein